MIVNKVGDIFSTDMPIIAHGTNCRGVCGGLAGVLFEKYPDARDAYLEFIARGKQKLGRIFLFSDKNGKIIADLFIQDLPGPNADIVAVRTCIRRLRRAAESGNLGVAIPRIGSGIGGLEWSDVSEVIHGEWGDSPIPLEIWSLPGN